MKRLYDISKAIINALSSVRLFARDLGEPVRLTDAECAMLFDNIRQDALNGHRAYLVVDIKKKDITFAHNTEGVASCDTHSVAPLFFQKLKNENDDDIHIDLHGSIGLYLDYQKDKAHETSSPIHLNSIF